jgi:hypothetical protein
MAIVTVPQILYPPSRLYGTANGDTCTLDAAEEFMAVVFRVPKSGTLNKIGWATGTAFTAAGYTLKISLETVATTAGQPVATTNATKTLYAANAESADLTSLAASTIYYTAINGVTGIAVTVGDYIAVTFRLLAITSGAMNVMYQAYPAPIELFNYSSLNTYNALYLGAAWTIRFGSPIMTLEYSDGFCPVPYFNPVNVQTTVTWNSGDNPDRRGLKFQIPYKCRLYGALVGCLPGNSDIDVILYAADEYTVMTGFPVTISNTQKASTALNDAILPFTTKPTIEANTWYRLVLLPKSANNISHYYNTPPDDGAYGGMTTMAEGVNCVYTTFNGVPNAGSHAWTDANYKPRIALMVDGIDTGGSIAKQLVNGGLVQ